jgi:peptide/nickel transport system permease protein
MKKYIIRRIALSMTTISIVSVIVFFMTHILPGNVARRYLGRDATPADELFFNKQNGLDRPLVVQFASWLRHLVHADLGTSMQFNKPVSELLLPAIGYSAKLAGLAFLLIIPISVIGGVVAAMQRGKTIDRIISVGGISASVIPEFIWAVILVLVFGVTFQFFPVTAFPVDQNPNAWTQIYHLILPSIALLLVLFGYIARITRAGVIEALESDYMRTAVLKGHSRRNAVFVHVLRNALLPTIAVVASQVPYLVGGLVAVEIVFNYPGFGSILLQAVGAHDFAVLQAGVMLTSAVIVFFQLIADLLFAVLNPRIRQRISE